MLWPTSGCFDKTFFSRIPNTSLFRSRGKNTILRGGDNNINYARCYSDAHDIINWEINKLNKKWSRDEMSQ